MKIPAVSRAIKPLLNFAMRNRPFVVKQAMIEKMLQQTFCEALEAGDMDFLRQRNLALDIHNVNYRITIGLHHDRLCVMPNSETADVVISGELKEFIRLAARREAPDTLFSQERLCLKGDGELGLAVRNLMSSVELATLPLWVQQGIKVADHFQRKPPAP